MTREQADAVRKWRTEEEATWRAIARLWVEAYGEDELAGEFLPGWGGNQLAGMELCDRAAAHFGQSMWAEPWN